MFISSDKFYMTRRRVMLCLVQGRIQYSICSSAVCIVECGDFVSCE
jgi:hypothetical protein